MTFSLIGSIVALITYVLAAVGLTGLFALMIVESFGIPPIPSEVILPFTGFLVAEGAFSFGDALGVSVAGALVGAFVAYAVGRWGRHRLADLGIGGLRLRASDLDRFDRWFALHGEATVALTRLLPFVRSYISYPAGTARMPPWRFGLYTLLGTLPWNLGLLYAGVVLGSHWSVILAYVQPLDLAFAAVLVAGVIYLGLVAAGRLTLSWPPHRVVRAGAAPVAPDETPPSTPP